MPSEPDSGLFSELMRLRPGRGVLTSNLSPRIGPLLRERAGIHDSAGPQETSAQLIAYLETLAESLPPDLALAFRVGLALHPEARFRFLDDRMEWLATEIDREARTARRRFEEATRLLEVRTKADGSASAIPGAAGRALTHQTEHLYRLRALASASDVRVGFITGDIRRVKCADIWVNPENTQMEMPRFEEHSVSAIIRYYGARRDETGHVIDDGIADELNRKMGQRGQVAPATAIPTDAGELRGSNGVRHIVHVAAVQGEPGAGYRQIHDIGACMTAVLDTAERLGDADPTLKTILFPILGSGVGGADPASTLRTLLGAALDHLLTVRGNFRTVLFLAYSAADLAACRTVFSTSAQLLVADDDLRENG